RVYGGALFVAGLIALGAGIGEFAEGLLATSGGEAVAVGEKAAAAAEEVKVTTGILPTYEETVADAPPTYEEAIEGNSPVYRSVLYLGGEKQEDSGYENEVLVGGGNDAADTNAGSEGSESTGAAGNAGAAIEDIPARRGIFGCGRASFMPCRHLEMTTFSQYRSLNPDQLIFLDAPVEDITNIVGEGVYDEILQEYEAEDYLRVAYALLKPGGRLYVMVSVGPDVGWMMSYSQQGENIFGDGSVDFIHGMEQVESVAERFECERIDALTHSSMLVLQK
ncbi:MAG: hypothetical protein OXD32_00330, partial [Endozoicomonadaceae bacterium]|nr:hypothetical protein [Endozoicomonadaceae bacterium]